MIHREFPDQASEWTDPVTRRRFLSLMGASLALAGLNGCSTQPAPGEDHALRSAAGIDGAGQAAVLRHGHAAGGAGHRRSRREPRGPSDEDRGQSQIIRPASAPPICLFRRPSSACTIRTARKP